MIVDIETVATQFFFWEYLFFRLWFFAVLQLLLTLRTKNVPISSMEDYTKSNYVAVILKTTKKTDKSFAFRLYIYTEYTLKDKVVPLIISIN
jgi:hypothetical protein